MSFTIDSKVKLCQVNPFWCLFLPMAQKLSSTGILFAFSAPLNLSANWRKTLIIAINKHLLHLGEVGGGKRADRSILIANLLQALFSKSKIGRIFQQAQQVELIISG
jgi:hypothetical protein